MARIPNDQIAARESFVFGIFRGDPDLAVQKANEQLKARFGSQMNSQRLYELRDRARMVNGGSLPISQAMAKGRVGTRVQAGRNAPEAAMASKGLPVKGTLFHYGDKVKAAAVQDAFKVISEQGMPAPQSILTETGDLIILDS